MGLFDIVGSDIKDRAVVVLLLLVILWVAALAITTIVLLDQSQDDRDSSAIENISYTTIAILGGTLIGISIVYYVSQSRAELNGIQ